MYIRKIGAAAGLAAGAAFALAPLASADIAGLDPTTVLDSEISAENHLFELETLFAGDSADITKGGPGVFDTFTTPADLAKDAPTTAAGGAPTPLEYELYGVNPITAGISSDTGPYSEFNGALTQFYNAFDVELYSLSNNGTLDTNTADYIENNALNHALGLGNTTDAAQYLLKFGMGDLKGYFGIFPHATPLDAAAATPAAADPAATDIGSTLTSEIHGLNSLFDLDASLAGIPSSDIITGTGPLPFDTIDTANTNSIFDTLLFGFNPANVTTDPGSYDVLNGSLGEFANAFNVEYYSLLNGGDMLPITDLIGTHADLLNGTVAEALSGFLQLGLSDLAGYF